jgi:hypothetical protein
MRGHAPSHHELTSVHLLLLAVVVTVAFGFLLRLLGA